jgi:hypothetical protein
LTNGLYTRKKTSWNLCLFFISSRPKDIKLIKQRQKAIELPSEKPISRRSSIDKDSDSEPKKTKAVESRKRSIDQIKPEVVEKRRKSVSSSSSSTSSSAPLEKSKERMYLFFF